MIKCKACPIFHDRMLNCKVAANQLRVGTLPEPWLSANRLEELKSRKAVAAQETGGELTSEKSGKETNPTANPVLAAAPKQAVRGVGRPRVYADPGARRKERQRAYMKKWRAKK